MVYPASLTQLLLFKQEACKWGGKSYEEYTLKNTRKSKSAVDGG